MNPSPDIIERVTHVRWPAAPSDYSPEAVGARWDAMQSAYQSKRIQEYAIAARQYEAEAIATQSTEYDYEH